MFMRENNVLLMFQKSLKAMFHKVKGAKSILVLSLKANELPELIKVMAV